jgi:hypothetical protein
VYDTYHATLLTEPALARWWYWQCCIGGQWGEAVQAACQADPLHVPVWPPVKPAFSVGCHELIGAAARLCGSECELFQLQLNYYLSAGLDTVHIIVQGSTSTEDDGGFTYEFSVQETVETLFAEVTKTVCVIVLDLIFFMQANWLDVGRWNARILAQGDCSVESILSMIWLAALFVRSPLNPTNTLTDLLTRQHVLDRLMFWGNPSSVENL